MLILDGRFERIRYNTLMNIDRFNEAFLMASELHRTQLRKGSKVPYVAHLMGVAYMVMDNGGTEDQVIAALLHDAVEDQGGEPTLIKIREKFGEHVAELVLGLSDSIGEPKPPWRARKEVYLKHLETAPMEVLEIVIADKMSNLTSVTRDYERIGDELWQVFTGGKEGSLWYYHEVYVVLSKRMNGYLLDSYKELLDRLDALVENQTKLMETL